VFKGATTSENPICSMRQTCPPSLNDMEVQVHFLDGRIEDMVIEMPNLLVEGGFILKVH